MQAAKIVGKPTLFRRLGAMFYDTWLVAGCLLAGSAIINGLNAYVNKDLLFQMLANLIDNAIKYTPESGKITVSLSLKEGTISIIFADSGPGISADKHDKVFQRFYRVEASRSLQPGNGLGLSLVQAVAKLHAGTITLSQASAYHNIPHVTGLKVEILLPTSE